MEEIEVGEHVRTKDGKIGIFDRYSSRKENSLYKSPFNCFIKIKKQKNTTTMLRRLYSKTQQAIN